MDSMKAWAALVAATAVVGAVFSALLPSGGLKRSFAVLVGVVFVCAAISPFAFGDGLELDGFGELFELEEGSDEFLKRSEDAAKLVAETGYANAIRAALEEIGCECESVAVECDAALEAKRITLSIVGAFDEKSVLAAAEKLCPSARLELRQ